MKSRILQDKKCVNNNVSNIHVKSRETERRKDYKRNCKEVSIKSKIIG